MSSEISTETNLGDGSPQTDALQPWQLFTLAGLVGATLTVFLSRGQSPSAVILLSLTIFAAAGVGIAALRTFMPLAGRLSQDGAQVLGGRTRAALEREKTLVLRSIKELEFDRDMGKVSDKDFTDMSVRLRARAARLMRQLDAGAGYRDQIEKEIERRIGKSDTAARPPAAASAPPRGAAYIVCGQCNASNDIDARFCKNCGTKFGDRS